MIVHGRWAQPEAFPLPNLSLALPASTDVDNSCSFTLSVHRSEQRVKSAGETQGKMSACLVRGDEPVRKSLGARSETHPLQHCSFLSLLSPHQLTVEQVRKAASDPKLPIHGITADFSSLDEVRGRR